MKKIRIGAGAGYGGDRIEPALDIIKHGNIDYIGFECLAERTIALAQEQMLGDPEKGYNELLDYRMTMALPLLAKQRVKLITNMGAANPIAAARAVKRIAGKAGIKNLKIAAVTGDNILDKIGKYLDREILETGEKLRSIAPKIISANAYLGIEGIIAALENGADIVIGGRIADPALFLAPIVREFGWDRNDFDLIGKGILAGHLLECSAQVTGGYFADPGYKEVPGLWNIGFPIAEVSENGDIVVTKLKQAGGMVTPATCKEQILYEIHDPASYFTPDGTADFSGVFVEELAKDRVLVKGAKGRPGNGLLKVSVGYRNGYFGEGEISYGGSGARARAALAGEIIRKRLVHAGIAIEELRMDLIGVNSLYKCAFGGNPCAVENNNEVRLRIAAKTPRRKDAEQIGNEVEALYLNGPAGGGGARKYVHEMITIASILIPKNEINIKVSCEEL